MDAQRKSSMNARLLILVAASTFSLAPLPVLAQTPPACAAMDASLTGEFTGWTSKTDITAATASKALSKAELTVGKAANVALPSTADVKYATQPEKPGGSVSHGGMVAFRIAEAGTYRVALGSGAWIDVLKNGKAIESTAHGHGPECSTIRKVVDFPLTPGRYVLQISANADAQIGVMVARRP
jgi:hypothetical protein